MPQHVAFNDWRELIRVTTIQEAVNYSVDVSSQLCHGDERLRVKHEKLVKIVGNLLDTLEDRGILTVSDVSKIICLDLKPAQLPQS